MNTSASPTNSAPRSKKNIARPPNVRAKQSAACISLRSVAAASAAPSVKIEMRTNAALFIRQNDTHGARIFCAYRARATTMCTHRQLSPATSIIPVTCRHKAGKGHRQRKLPGEIHELIDPGPGQRAADPNVDEDQSRQFHEEPHIRGNKFQKRQGRMPPA